MVSQADVVKPAKVSFMTVSRVVNSDPRVKEETRQRVQGAKDKTADDTFRKIEKR